MRIRPCLRPLLLTPLLAPLLSACAVGPNYAPPALPGGVAATFVRADARPNALDVSAPRLAPWWRDLDDALLSDLIDEALASSPTIDLARARITQARAQVRGAQAAFAPVASAGASVGDLRMPAMVTGGPAQSSSVFVAGFDALWELDLFGGQRRGLEGARAQLTASDADADYARLSLTAEVARQYLALRATQERLAIARRGLVAQEKITALTLQLESAGKASRLDREASERALDGRRSLVAALEASRDEIGDGLAVLVGKPPGALDERLAPRRAIPLPPAEVSIGDPTSMIARRPDIRAAEQRLHAATAGIGGAQAARLPRIGLAGVIGLGGAAKGDWTASDNLFSLAAPTLQWNLADFGRGKAGVDQAKAGRDAADAVYRASVLAALQDAEGALSRYGQARTELALSSRSAQSARNSADLANAAWRAGRTSALAALSADLEQQAAEDALARSQASLTTNYVGLQKALAAGWRPQT